jgi:hypothetical protein
VGATKNLKPWQSPNHAKQIQSGQRPLSHIGERQASWSIAWSLRDNNGLAWQSCFCNKQLSLHAECRVCLLSMKWDAFHHQDSNTGDNTTINHKATTTKCLPQTSKPSFIKKCSISCEPSGLHSAAGALCNHPVTKEIFTSTERKLGTRLQART